MTLWQEILHKLGFLSFIPWATFISGGPVENTLSTMDKTVLIRMGDRECQSGDVFEAKVALTPEEHRIGLSGRRNPLEENEAMIFVFPRPRSTGFWMMETYIPLSIGFFSPSGALVQSYEMSVEQDPSRPQAIYPSNAEVSAAVEAPPGAIPAAGGNVTTEPRYLCIEKP